MWLVLALLFLFLLFLHFGEKSWANGNTNYKMRTARWHGNVTIHGFKMLRESKILLSISKKVLYVLLYVQCKQILLEIIVRERSNVF